MNQPTDIGPESLKSAIVRIFVSAPTTDDEKASAGVGFLVDDQHVLTCAHVVYGALALAEDAPLPEAAVLPVDLPLLPGPSGDGVVLTASVERLIPRQPSGAGDVAVLRLAVPITGTRPVRLAEADGYWNHRAGAFGLPDGRPAGVWHSGVLKAPQGDGWVQMNLDPASGGYVVSRGFSGGPVWDESLGAVVGMIVVAEAGTPPVSYLIPTSLLAAAWPQLRELIRPPSPFRSLKPFEESDHAIFHGRQADSERIARAVGAKGTTTLIGPSGCGKSSLVRAGVIPRRRAAGDIPLLLRPTQGSSPLHVLAAELVPLLEPEITELERLPETDRLADRLAQHGLHDVVPRVLKRHHSARLLVVIDQFEDLLDLPDDAVRAFANTLAGERPPADVAVLATLRADFVESVQANERLRPLVSPTFDSLLPMSTDQLREAITKPVEQVPGVRFEDGLVERILADTGDDPRVLPLLAFTLDRLWSEQHGAALTFQTYEALGGVRGALGAYAGQAWAGVEDEDKSAARRLLPRLVRLPIGAENATRRVVPRAELGDVEWRVVQRLAAARLIILNAAQGAYPADALAEVESIELAHEVLITAWSELAQQVTTDKAFLVWRETLRHDVARWQDNDNAPDRLPTKDALAEAEKWLPARDDDLSDEERDYLTRGGQYRRSRIRRRRALIGMVSVLILAAGGAGIVSARAQQDAAQKAAVVRSGTLAADSQALSASDPGLAAQLAVAAYRSSPTQAATTALYSALQAPLLDNALATTKDTVERTAAQANGPLAAAVDKSGAVRVWDLGDPAKPILASTTQTAGASGIALAPHAPLLAAACSTSGLCLWNLTNPAHPVVEARLSTPTSGPFGISSMAISPDGTLLAAASKYGYTLLWSIAQPTQPRLLADLPNPSTDTLFAAVTFAPNGSFLAESHENGTTSLWSLSNPAAPTRIATINSGYQDISINPSGTILAGASDGNVDLWNIQSPLAPAQIKTDLIAPYGLDFQTLSISPDGRTLAFGGTNTYTYDSQLCLLDLVDFAQDPDSARPVCQSIGFDTLTMAYTSSGALLTGGLDKTVRLWSTSPALIANATVYNPDSTPVVSTGGHYMVAAITDLQKSSKLGLWNLDAPGEPALEGTIPLPSAGAAYAAFLDTNVVLTDSRDGGIQIWNISDPHHPRKTASLGNVDARMPNQNSMAPPDGIGSDGNVLAVLGIDGLHLWHVSSTGTATQSGTFSDPAFSDGPASVLSGGHTAFMATKTGIDWWNISDPAHPMKTSFSPLAHADQGEGAPSSTGLFAAVTPPDVVDGGSILNLYDLANGHVLSTATVSRQTGNVLALSNDGHLLTASGVAGNGLNIWDTTDARSPKFASSLVTAFDLRGVTFSADDKMMADWTRQAVQLWDTQDPGAPVLVGTFSPISNADGTTSGEQVAAAGFTQAGKKLVISTHFGGPSSVYVLDTDSQQAADQLCSFATSPITPAQWAQDAPGVSYENPCSR